MRVRLPAARRVAGGVRGWLARQEGIALVAMLAVAAGLFAFAELGDAVVEGDTRAFDEFLLLGLRSASDPSDPLGPRWLEEMMRDFTALGGTGVLALVTLAAAGFLVLTGKRRAAAAVGVAVLGGLLLS
ncbi:MAG: hypothetical protein ICV73_06495, partial [Acetobacteraceae bacterium]|nr:hypothetical protein [Acetobacteraceae bacterium]